MGNPYRFEYRILEYDNLDDLEHEMNILGEQGFRSKTIYCRKDINYYYCMMEKMIQ